jgi:FkbM family methyltransferase
MTSPRKFRKFGVFTLTEILAMGLPLALVASLNISRAPLFAALNLLGRTDGCTFAHSLTVDRDVRNLNLITQQLMASSSVDQQDNKLYRWQTPHGVFWAPAGTSVPFLLSEQVNRFYGDGPRRVRAGDVVLDCGANIGVFTWEALSAGAKLVVAIEPAEDNIESLRRNFAKEIAQGRVIVYPKGVWDETTTLQFHEFENSALDSLVMATRPEEHKQARTVEVPVTTIDQLVKELGLQRVDFIKMDIEGAERNAIRGASQTLLHSRPRMSLVTENLPDDPQVIPALVKEIRHDYQYECGKCSQIGAMQIQADAYYFF